MAKFRTHKSGKAKNGKSYLSYNLNLPESKLKAAEFISKNGMVLEYIATVEPRRIIISHKEDLFKEDLLKK